VTHGIIRVLAQAASVLAVQSGALMQQLTQHVTDIPAQQEKNVLQVLVKLFAILAAQAKAAEN
jgi:hypothetical protein